MTPSSHTPEDNNLIKAAEMGFTLAHFAGPSYPQQSFANLVLNYPNILLAAYKSICHLTFEKYVGK